MTNTKSTKRALLVSVMAMVICFTMLLGTTFAWFTDSETSRNNIIKSGNLDIAFEYYDGDSWETVASDSELFNNAALWEPGYVAVAYVRVKNIGTLALNYKLGMNIYAETGSKNVLGNEFNLSTYIKYAVKTSATAEFFENTDVARNEAIALGSNGLQTPYVSDEGALVAGSEWVYHTIVVYMPTTVENEANYAKGEAVPTIQLGVNVSATQMAYETDDFNTKYDDPADVPNTTVTP